MNEAATYRIEQFIADLTRVSFSDVLVHVGENNKAVQLLNASDEPILILPAGQRLNQLHKIAVQHQKTADIQSLCVADQLFCWTYRDQEIRTPLGLIPARMQFRKTTGDFRLDIQAENQFVNPFLISTLEHRFELDLSPCVTDLDGFLQQITETGLDFRLEPFRALGNFHHHRYEILRDLEEIAALEQPGNLLASILGHPDSGASTTHIELHPQKAFPSDPDQDQVFKLLADQDLVIQGPPGTGKSQVLGNLLVKLLAQEEKHLVVSEKRTALEVLANKLAQCGLRSFAFLAHAQSQPGEFIAQLKQSWQELETAEKKMVIEPLRSPFILGQLQLHLDKLGFSSLLKSRSLSFFQDFQQDPAYPLIPFVTDVPEIEQWQHWKEALAEAVDTGFDIRLAGSLRQSAWQHLTRPEEELGQLLHDWRALHAVLGCENLSDLEQHTRMAARIQLLENERDKPYLQLHGAPRKKQKFEQLARQWQQAQERLQLLEAEKQLWKSELGKSELEALKREVQTGSWLKKRKAFQQLKTRMVRQHPDPIRAVDAYLDYHRLAEETLSCKHALQEYGIQDPAHEINLALYVLQQLDSWHENELNQVQNLPAAQRKQLMDVMPQLKATERQLKNLLLLQENEPIGKQLEQLHHELPQLLLHRKLLVDLPPALYKLLRLADTVNDIEAIILKSNWISFTGLFPELAALNGDVLAQKLNELLHLEHGEQQEFVREILAGRAAKFREYHQLLQAPAAKLSAEKKALRQQLKNGKAILVKEFGKSRQHRSIRELLASDAEVWINLLCPLYLCTPLQVSKHFALRENIFGLVIFDEASQIVLPKALAALQRGKRMVVAGDSQQMAPTSLFSGSTGAVDLLHQAAHYLPNVHLKHHYRSRHPALIAFSNHHFYNDELLVFPEAQHPKQPVTGHYIANGEYENRQNIREAKAVADAITEAIKKEASIGVVAFSEQQLLCIWNQLSAGAQAKLQQRIHDKSAFMKALEQVQGEECEHLIISLGYGRNPDGEFHLRFGPLSQRNGHKRLNVLLTRAISRLDFFTSVRAADFPLTANEAVNLLRQFLQWLEADQEQQVPVLPFGLLPEPDGLTLCIDHIHERFPDSNELLTFHRVMTQRKWKLRYTL